MGTTRQCVSIPRFKPGKGGVFPSLLVITEPIVAEGLEAPLAGDGERGVIHSTCDGVATIINHMNSTLRVFGMFIHRTEDRTGSANSFSNLFRERSSFSLLTGALWNVNTVSFPSWRRLSCFRIIGIIFRWDKLFSNFHAFSFFLYCCILIWDDKSQQPGRASGSMEGTMRIQRNQLVRTLLGNDILSPL